MKEYVYLNKKLVDASKASVSVFDRGLNYGDGLFETLKAVDGKPLFLNEHIKRLLQGARALHMDIPSLRPFVEEALAGAIETLLRKNRLEEGEASVKLIVTRGADRGSHLPAKGILPTTIIVTRKIDEAALAVLRKKGVKAILVSDISPALPGVKSLNYIASVLAKIEAAKAGAFEALFTKDGQLTEGGSSNVFAVKGGRLMTPALASGRSTGLLPGVIRGEVKRLAKEHGIPFSEGPLSIKALEEADEAFLTNSITEAVPLVKIGTAKVGNSRPGPITRLFQGWLRPFDRSL
ncbi:D-alanine transaminase [uncultured bacterium]|nr:D-alanine transaminase [uncultured bacterium]